MDDLSNFIIELQLHHHFLSLPNYVRRLTTTYQPGAFQSTASHMQLRLAKGYVQPEKIGISPSTCNIVRTVKPQAMYPARVILLRKERVIVKHAMHSIQ